LKSKLFVGVALGFLTIGSAKADPEHIQPFENNPGADTASEIFAPALQGGSSEERANRIYEQNVDRQLDTIEKHQGPSERLRQEQLLGRKYR
jgi:hypothetical protein